MTLSLLCTYTEMTSNQTIDYLNTGIVTIAHVSYRPTQHLLFHIFTHLTP